MFRSKARPRYEKPRRLTWAAPLFSISLLLAGCSSEAKDTLIEIASDHPLSHEAYRTASLPSWFAEELFNEAQATEIYANEEGTVFGINASKSPTAAFDEICSSMENKGWLRVESGMPHCSTFIREEGDPSWALVSCTNVGGSTCIVVCVKGELT